MYYFKSIRFRLTLWYLLIVLILLIFFGIAAYFMLSYQLHQSVDDSLTAKAIELGTGLRAGVQDISYIQKDYLVLVYDANNTLLQQLGPNIQFSKTSSLIQSALLGKHSFSNEVLEEQTVRLYATPVDVSSNTRLVVIIGKPLTDIQQILDTLRSVFVFSTLAALILAALGGSSLVNRTLYPIRRMMGVAEEVRETNLDRRIEIQREDELGRLAGTLNQMMERLEAAFNRERQFAGDASHELRTPLTVIEAEATLALEKERTTDEYKKSLATISQEVEFMSTILGSLLSIARNESGKEVLKLEIINLKDVLHEISLKYETLAKEKGLDYIVDVEEDLPIKGDKVKIKQLIGNLIDNAIKYTQEGVIAIRAFSQNDSALVSISDTGAGIASEHIPFIFERFYRVDKARSRAAGGAGLGLSIVKQIADAHGGTVEVKSHPGSGSTFNVLLPLAN